MKKLYSYLFIGPLLFLFAWQNTAAQVNAPRDLTTEFCELVKNPEKYDGQEVTVRASFRWGFEWQNIFCLGCLDPGETRLETNYDGVTLATRKILKNLPENDGTINAVFTGTFRNEGSLSSKFRFYLKEISQVKLVFKWGGHPDNLPEKEKKKLCGVGGTFKPLP